MRTWLKNIRENLGFTHEEVSSRCQISRSFYTCIENGTKSPSVTVAKRIGAELKFDWTLFFNGECYSREQKRDSIA